jgi:hypothetical protein
MARPSEFTQLIFDEICNRLADGESLRGVCRDPEMPDRITVYRWMRGNEALSGQYTRAITERCVTLAEDAIDIADDGSNDWMDENDPGNPGYALRGEHIQRSKLRVDTRKWFLSKLQPKVYGDKQALEVTGNLDIAQGIIAARKRAAKKEV